MGPRGLRLVAVLAVAALAVAGTATFIHFVPDLHSADQRAPDFTVQTLPNGTFTLSEHRGEVVVLDLMAVDCPSCRITERAVLRLAEERPNVTILSVDIWVDLEDPAYLMCHMEGSGPGCQSPGLGASWAYGMDNAAWEESLLGKYDAFEISKVVVIDAEGFITWTKVGGITADPLIAAVDEANAGGAPPQSTLQLGLVGFAVFAGVASFFAPCAFPLLPGYMAYSLSMGQRRQAGDPSQSVVMAPGRVRDALGPGFSAAAGIFVVYGTLGVLVAAFGGAASRWIPYLQPVIGFLAIGLGIALLAGFTMERVVAPLQRGIDRVRRRITGDDREGTLSGYFGYGLGYGAAAAGCVAPVFLQLSLTAAALGVVTGLKIFALYAGVSALLMIIATIVAVKARTWLQRRAGTVVRVVNRASGVVLILAGIYLFWYFQRGTALPFG